MATKKQALAKTDYKNTVQLKLEEGKSEDKQFAELSLSATTLNAMTARTFTHHTTGLTNITETIAAMHEKVKAVNSGNTHDLEATLTAQVSSLNAIYGEMARRAALNMGEHLQATESYMRLALKAQAQCARTIEVIATMKNPPVIFAKQANISNGNQQVNNGSVQNNKTTDVPTHAGETVNQSNELLEVDHGSTTMDFRAETAASGKDKAVSALDTIDRGYDARG